RGSRAGRWMPPPIAAGVVAGLLRAMSSSIRTAATSCSSLARDASFCSSCARRASISSSALPTTFSRRRSWTRLESSSWTSGCELRSPRAAACQAYAIGKACGLATGSSAAGLGSDSRPMRMISSSRTSASGVLSNLRSARRKAARQPSNRLRISIMLGPLLRTTQEAPRTGLLQGRLEQLVDPPVLVVPGVGVAEPVALERVGRDPPVVLAQFDQLLGEQHAVLEEHVVVDHAVGDQQVVLQAGGVLDRRGAGIGLRVDVRRVQDVRRVLVVVLPPVGDRAQGGTGLEHARLAEQGHEGHEAAVAAAVDADAVAVGLAVGHGPVQAVEVVLELGVAHVAVDRGAPVAAVTFRAAVVEIEHDVALLHQQVVEHLLAEIIGPALL